MLKKQYWGIYLCRNAGQNEFVANGMVYINDIEFYDENYTRIHPIGMTNPQLLNDPRLGNGVSPLKNSSGVAITSEEAFTKINDGVSSGTVSLTFYSFSDSGMAGALLGFMFSSKVTIGRVIHRDNQSIPTSYSPYNTAFMYSDDGVDWIQYRLVNGRFSLTNSANVYEVLPANMLSLAAAKNHFFRAFYPHTITNKGVQGVALQYTSGQGWDYHTYVHKVNFYGTAGASFNEIQAIPVVLGGDYTNQHGGSLGTNQFQLKNALFYDEDWSASSGNRRSLGISEYGAAPASRVGLMQPTFIRGEYSRIYVGSYYDQAPRGFCYRWTNDGVTFHTAKYFYKDWVNSGTFVGDTFDVSSFPIGVEAAFKHFRVKVTHHGADGLVQSIALGKVEFASSIGGTNLISGGVASSSSGSAADAFSGAGWVSGSEAHPWVQYSFSSPVTVREVRLVAPASGVAPMGVQIEVSDDNRYWTSLAFFYGYAFNAGVASLDLFAGLPRANVDYKYRYLKVQAKGVQEDWTRWAYNSRLALQRLRFKDADGNFVSPVKVTSTTRHEREDAGGTSWGLERGKLSSLFGSDAPGDYFQAMTSGNCFFDDRYKKWPESKGALRTTENHPGPRWMIGPPEVGFNDFTLEAYVCPTAGGHGGANARIAQSGVWGVSGGWALVCVGSENPTRVGFYSSASISTPLVISASTIPNDVFTHVCVERVNGVFSLYINGLLDASAAVENVNCAFSSYRLFSIGANHAGGEAFSGYIDLMRFTAPRARYKGPFTPPVSFAEADDPCWDYTVLAVGFDGSNGATVADDVKGNNWTFNGNAKISTAKSVAGGASLLLDGTGDYLSYGGNLIGTFGTSDATIEFWALVDQEIDGNNYTEQDFMSFDSLASSGTVGYGNFRLARRINTGTGITGCNLYFYAAGNWYGSPLNVNGNGCSHVSLNPTSHPHKWGHYALVRRSGVLYSFQDGVLVGTVSGRTTDPMGSIFGVLYLGGGVIRPLAALYSDFRITNGVARYAEVTVAGPTGATTKSNKPSDYDKCVLHLTGALNFTAYSNACIYPLDELGLLLSATSISFSGVSRSYMVYPASTRHGVPGVKMTMNGQAETGISYLPSTVGDFAVLPTSVFTAEAYFTLPASTSGNATYSSGNGSSILHFGSDATTSLRLLILNNNLYLRKGSSPFSDILSAAYTPATTYHIALVADGTGTIRLFLNGVFATSGTIAAGIVSDRFGIWGPMGTYVSPYKYAASGSTVEGVRFTAAVRYPGTTTFQPAGFPRLADDPMKAQVKMLWRGVVDDLPVEVMGNPAAAVRCLKKTPLTVANVSLAAGGAFSAGAGVFNGSSSVISFTPSTAQSMSGDFTFETFIILNVLTSGASWPGDAADWQMIFSSGADNGTGVQFAIGVSQIIFAQGSTVIVSGPHGISTGAAVHVAVQRLGDVFSLYVGGVRVAQTTLAIDLGTVFGSVARIGAGAVGSWFNGKMNDVLLSTVAQYGESFPVRTSAFAQDKSNPYWSSTVLALHLTTTAYLYDALGHEMVDYGFSTGFELGSGNFRSFGIRPTAYNQSPYSRGIVPRNTMDYNFGTGDFEISMSIKLNGVYPSAFIGNYNAEVEGTWVFGMGDNYVFFDSVSAEGGGFVCSGTIALSVWKHIRVGRKNGYLYILVGGVLSGAKYDYTTNLISTSANPVGLFGKGRTSYLIHDSTSNCYGPSANFEDIMVFNYSPFTHPWLPAARFPENSTDDPYWNKVSLLTHMDQGDPGDSSFSTLVHDSSKYGFRAVASGTNNSTQVHLDLLLDFGREVKFSEASAMIPKPFANEPAVWNPGSVSLWVYENTSSTWMHDGQLQQAQLMTLDVAAQSAIPATSGVVGIGTVFRGVFVAPSTGLFLFRTRVYGASGYGPSWFRIGRFSERGRWTVITSSGAGYSDYVSVPMEEGEEWPFEFQGMASSVTMLYRVLVTPPGRAEMIIPIAWVRNMHSVSRYLNEQVPAVLSVSGVTTPEMKDQWSSVALGTIPFHRAIRDNAGLELSARLNVPRVASEPEQHRYWRVVFLDAQYASTRVCASAVQLYERMDGPPLSEFSKVALSSMESGTQSMEMFLKNKTAVWTPLYCGNLGAFVQFDCISPVRPKFLTVGWTDNEAYGNWTRVPGRIELHYSDDGSDWVRACRLRFPASESWRFDYTGVHYFPLLFGQEFDSHVLNEYYAFLEDKANAPLAIIGNDETLASQRKGCVGMAADRMPSNYVGSVYGTVSVAGNPVRRRVVLLDYASLAPLQSVWSNSNGNYEFKGVDLTQNYLVISQDYQRTYNAVVQDSVTAKEQ